MIQSTEEYSILSEVKRLRHFMSVIHSGIYSAVQKALILQGWRGLLYSPCHTYKGQVDLLYFDQGNMKAIVDYPV